MAACAVLTQCTQPFAAATPICRSCASAWTHQCRRCRAAGAWRRKAFTSSTSILTFRGGDGRREILMAEAGETLLQILQSITATHTQLVDILSRKEQRQQENN